MRKEVIPPEVMRLVRNLFRHLMNKHDKPSFRHVGMALDAKVAKVEAPKKAHSAEFPYWLTLATLNPRKPIHIPLYENPYALAADGDEKAFVQFNVRRGTAIGGQPGALDIARIKEAAPVFSLDGPRPQIVDTLGIDVGMRTLVATSMGELLGRNLIDRLSHLDAQISRLAAERQRQGLPVHSRRYDTLVSRLQSFLKNEIGRVLNGQFARVHPAKVIESLDFRSPDLSRRLNRLVQNFGRTWFRQKLDMLSEQYGFLVEEVWWTHWSRLLGISKRGDVYLRTLLTHGARVVVNFQIKNRNPWIDKLLSRRPHNVAVVAVANKMARTIWALLVKNSVFETNHTAVKAAA